MKEATIKDVARIAGVSIATVSRVINQSGNVKEETIYKVKEAIKETNFIPNTHARNLKQESSKTIGIIVSDISNSYFTVMAKAIEDKLREKNYNMIICSTNEDKNQELKNLELFVSNKVDGIIINTTNYNDELIVRISNDIPIVLINRRLKNLRYVGDLIDSNNEEGIMYLTNHLISKGHTKIGIINGELRVSTGHERFMGFVRAMKKINIDVMEDYPYRYDSEHFTQNDGYLGAKHLMNLSDPPTALIVCNNAMTIGALKYLKNNGIKIPDDVSLLTYGNIENHELLYVDIGYTRLDPFVIGQKASNFVLDRIIDPKIPNREAILTPIFQEGKSVAQL